MPCWELRKARRRLVHRMVEVGFGFGSNVGDKVANIQAAMHALRGSGLVEGLRCSAMYRTAPWGDVDQDWFINACAVGRSQVAPHDLLRGCQDIEARMGRQRIRRWGPRNIDVDILFYNDARINSSNLNLPHPELLNRAFVLVPLLDIRPNLELMGVKLSDALAKLDSADIVLYRPQA
jgi:2-amino-4-hydroxy-6-hydroxymethyldihydropteridine diphosphokinase